METVKVHEAKTHLSRLLERVEQGEEITISRGDKPVARLIPIAAQRVRRQPGRLKGKIWMADDFDAPLPKEILDAFAGGSDDCP